jgi:hypothetical protein
MLLTPHAPHQEAYCQIYLPLTVIALFHPTTWVISENTHS